MSQGSAYISWVVHIFLSGSKFWLYEIGLYIIRVVFWNDNLGPCVMIFEYNLIIFLFNEWRKNRMNTTFNFQRLILMWKCDILIILQGLLFQKCTWFIFPPIKFDQDLSLKSLKIARNQDLWFATHPII